MAVTYQSVASSNSATCSKPTGTTSGDLLVASVTSYTDAASLTGWTAVAGASGSYSSAYFGTILWKIAGGSEPASYTFTTAGAAVFHSIIIRVSGHDATTPIDVSSVITDGTGVIPSVTTTSAGALLIAYALSDVTTTAPTGMTSRANVGPDTTLGAFYLGSSTEDRASAGATGTRTYTGAGGTTYVAGMVAIAPGAGGTPVTVNADTAAGTGQAHDAVVVAIRNDSYTASAATGTGQAYDATVTAVRHVSAAADVATGTGQAYDVVFTGGSSYTATAATGSGQAYDALLRTGAIVVVDMAPGSGQAHDVTVTAVQNVSYTATVATGSGQAYDVTRAGGPPAPTVSTGDVRTGLLLPL